MSTSTNNYFKVWKRNELEKRSVVHEVFFFDDTHAGSIQKAFDKAKAARAKYPATGRDPAPVLSVFRRPDIFGPWSGAPRIGKLEQRGRILVEDDENLPAAS